MLPILVVLICVGWRILQRRKAEEKEEMDYMVKTRPIDPDESVKINSDDESIPYKKEDTTEDSPLPSEPIKIVEDSNVPFTYGQPYPPEPVQPYQAERYEPQPYDQSYNESGLPKTPQQKQWTGETEIN